MDNGTKRALEDVNRKMDLILEMLGSQVEAEIYNRNTNDTQAQQTITDLDIADIISEQTITDLDLRILELEV
jgi:hypothetical protein